MNNTPIIPRAIRTARLTDMACASLQGDGRSEAVVSVSSLFCRRWGDISRCHRPQNSALITIIEQRAGQNNGTNKTRQLLIGERITVPKIMQSRITQMQKSSHKKDVFSQGKRVKQVGRTWWDFMLTPLEENMRICSEAEPEPRSVVSSYNVIYLQWVHILPPAPDVCLN